MKYGLSAGEASGMFQPCTPPERSEESSLEDPCGRSGWSGPRTALGHRSGKRHLRASGVERRCRHFGTGCENEKFWRALSQCSKTTVRRRTDVLSALTLPQNFKFEYDGEETESMADGPDVSFDMVLKS